MNIDRQARERKRLYSAMGKVERRVRLRLNPFHIGRPHRSTKCRQYLPPERGRVWLAGLRELRFRCAA